jgi:hypothetical protein
MGRRQPAGMGVQRGAPVQREPVVLLPCRGCLTAPTLESAVWDGHQFVCADCGITDPHGVFGPMRPAGQEGTGS